MSKGQKTEPQGFDLISQTTYTVFHQWEKEKWCKYDQTPKLINPIDRKRIEKDTQNIELAQFCFDPFLIDSTTTKQENTANPVLFPLSYHLHPELRTLKLKKLHRTPEIAKKHTKPIYAVGYTKTNSGNRITHRREYLPLDMDNLEPYTKLTFRCPYCEATRTKTYKKRKMSIPTHTHTVNQYNPKTRQNELRSIKVSLYLSKAVIGKHTIYDIDTITPIYQARKQPNPQTKKAYTPPSYKKIESEIRHIQNLNNPQTKSLQALNNRKTKQTRPRPNSQPLESPYQYPLNLINHTDRIQPLNWIYGKKEENLI